MDILFSEVAERELDDMDTDLRKIFLKHAEKLACAPLQRHLKFGIPFNVENVTKQARMVYSPEGDTLYITHCFKNHKLYERWYKSFK